MDFMLINSNEMTVNWNMRIGLGVLLRPESFDRPDLPRVVTDGTSRKFYSLPGSVSFWKKF
jgi:hypothetical protein